MKFLTVFWIVVLGAATAVSACDTDRKLRLIYNLLNRKCLMSCVMRNALWFGEQTDCFEKFRLPRRYERVYERVTGIVTETIFQRHQCIDLRRPRAVRQCLSTVQRALRRRFRLRTMDNAQQALFFEVSSKLVHVLADFRVYRRRTNFGEPVRIDSGFDSEIRVRQQESAQFGARTYQQDNGLSYATQTSHSALLKRQKAVAPIANLQVPASSAVSNAGQPPSGFGNGAFYDMAQTLSAGPTAHHIGSALTAESTDGYYEEDTSPEVTTAIVKAHEPMVVNSELLKQLSCLVGPELLGQQVHEEEEHEVIQSPKSNKFTQIPKRNPFYGQTSLIFGNVATLNLMQILQLLQAPDPLGSPIQNLILPPEDQALISEIDSELIKSASVRFAPKGSDFLPEIIESSGNELVTSQKTPSVTANKAIRTPDFHAVKTVTPLTPAFHKVQYFPPLGTPESQQTGLKTAQREQLKDASASDKSDDFGGQSVSVITTHPEPIIATKVSKVATIFSKSQSKPSAIVVKGADPEQPPLTKKQPEAIEPKPTQETTETIIHAEVTPSGKNLPTIIKTSTQPTLTIHKHTNVQLQEPTLKSEPKDQTNTEATVIATDTKIIDQTQFSKEEKEISDALTEGNEDVLLIKEVEKEKEEQLKAAQPKSNDEKLSEKLRKSGAMFEPEDDSQNVESEAKMAQNDEIGKQETETIQLQEEETTDEKETPKTETLKEKIEESVEKNKEVVDKAFEQEDPKLSSEETPEELEKLQAQHSFEDVKSDAEQLEEMRQQEEEKANTEEKGEALKGDEGGLQTGGERLTKTKQLAAVEQTDQLKLTQKRAAVGNLLQQQEGVKVYGAGSGILNMKPAEHGDAAPAPKDGRAGGWFGDVIGFFKSMIF